MNRTPPWGTGAALAITFAAIYIACALAVSLFPDSSLEFFNTWAHGIDLRLVKRPATDAVTMGEWAFGFVTAVAASFLAGALYGWARNLFTRK